MDMAAILEVCGIKLDTNFSSAAATEFSYSYHCGWRRSVVRRNERPARYPLVYGTASPPGDSPKPQPFLVGHV